MINAFIGKYKKRPMYFAIQRFADNRAALVSLIILTIIVLMAVFAPLVAEQTKLLHENGVFHHYFVDGKCMGHLKKLKEIGIDVFSSLELPPSGDGNLKIAKEKVGNKICLYGNVGPIQVVEKGRKKDIIKATKKAIDNAAEGGGFILGLGEFVS